MKKIDESLNPVDVTRICRICLEQKNDTISIFTYLTFNELEIVKSKQITAFDIFNILCLYKVKYFTINNLFILL